MAELAEFNMETWEEEFVYDEDSSRYTVLVAQEELVFVGKTLWRKPKVLEFNSGNSSQFIMNIQPSVAQSFLRLLKTGAFPSKLKDLIDMTAVVCQLRLKDVQAKCFGYYVQSKMIDLGFPTDCSAENILKFFEFLCERPFRTQNIYHDQLARLKVYAGRNTDLMAEAIEIVKKTQSRPSNLNLEPLPVPFDCTKLAIGVGKFNGVRKTLAFINDRWQPINLLGPNISLDTINHSRFTLFYGSKLFFQKKTSLCMIDLTSSGAYSVKLEGCVEHFSRGNRLYAIQKQQNLNTVLFWQNETFVPIYSTPNDIKRIDYSITHDCVGILESIGEKVSQLLLAKQNGTHSLEIFATFSGDTLGVIKDFNFHQSNVIIRTTKHRDCRFHLCVLEMQKQQLESIQKWKNNYHLIHSVAENIFASDGKALLRLRGNEFVKTNEEAILKTICELDLLV